MNITRLISGLLGFSVVAFVLVIANVYIVDIAFAIIAILSLNEYFKAFKEKGAHPMEELGYLCAGLIAGLHLIPQINILEMIPLLIPILILILFLKVIVTNMKITILDVTITLFGICYVVLFLMFLPLIHGMEQGKILVWFIPFIAWGTDTFAYVIGKNFGKHKFSKVSPNKSIEGCVGGILGAVIVTLLFTWCVNTYSNIELSYTFIIGMSIVLSMISQIGDFSASSIKRYAGLKDFSHLIPGHGGMLDRIDSVIFVAPFAYLFFMFM